MGKENINQFPCFIIFHLVLFGRLQLQIQIFLQLFWMQDWISFAVKVCKDGFTRQLKLTWLRWGKRKHSPFPPLVPLAYWVIRPTGGSLTKENQISSVHMGTLHPWVSQRPWLAHRWFRSRKADWGIEDILSWGWGNASWGLKGSLQDGKNRQVV